MKEKWQHIFKPGSCPSLEVLKQYHDGSLSTGQHFSVENHLAVCEMCNDVLEGYDAVKNPETVDRAVKEISRRLQLFLFPKQKRTFFTFQKIAIAASLLMLLGGGLIYFLNNKTEHPLAQTKPVSNSPQSPKKDTLLIVMNENEPVKHSATSVNGNAMDNRVVKFKAPVVLDSIRVESNVAMMTEQSDRAEEMVTLDQAVPSEKLKSMEVSPLSRAKGDQWGVYTIQGIVKDVNGEILPGVAITVKGTTKGTVTNAQGEFFLQVPDTSSRISFTYIGYQPIDMKVDSRHTMDIAMNQDITRLDEVVVIGYGVQKKSNVTGAIASVETKKEKESVHYNQALQGKVAGIQVVKEKRFSAGIADLQERLQRNPDDRKASLLLAKKYIDMKSAPQAIGILEHLETITDDTVESDKIDAIITLLKVADFKEAGKKMKKVK